MWLLLAVPQGLYFGWYLVAGYDQHAAHPPVLDLVSALGTAWYATVGPALVGGPFDWSALPPGLDLTAASAARELGATAALVVLVAVVVVRRPRSLVGLAFGAATFAFSFGIPEWGRLIGVAELRPRRALQRGHARAAGHRRGSDRA